METSRALATIQRIGAIEAIAGADSIETAVVGGWKVVVRKGQFKPDDLCVYIEVDAALPLANPAFAFLAQRGAKKLGDGSQVHVLKTARLRGVFSQGIVFKLAELIEQGGADLAASGEPPIGADVTAALGITLYEPPIPAELSGEALPFPRVAGLTKTDEERLQNIPAVLAVMDDSWYPTQKIDGTSGTWTMADGVFQAAGHNWAFVETDSQTFWAMARHYDFPAKLAALSAELNSPEVAIQGEVFGPGIQGNPLKINQVRVAIFNVIAQGRRLGRSQWPDWALELAVPVIPGLARPTSLDQALAQADGFATQIGSGRAEGIVWRSDANQLIEVADKSGQPIWTRPSFKVVSNRYLMKHDR